MMGLKNIILPFILLAAAGFAAPAAAQEGTAENLFLITLDGLRWEELFGGADDSLTADLRFVRDTAALHAAFWAESREARRQRLMPWFWSVLAREGQLFGNRWLGNRMDLTNLMWFSYPGYNEILVGYSDPNINSNDKRPNPNVTVLEWLHRQEGFEGLVAAFGSWDVFPYIINEERSGIPVNAGFRQAQGPGLSERELFLNELQGQIPSPWGNVRLDAFTHHYALEYIKREHPRVVYIAYGETDDFAHDSRYDHYLHAARRTDAFIQQLWEYCQQDPFYAGKTAFVITTDHGRGDQPKQDWTSHGKIYKGANAVWAGLLGPGVPPLGERNERGQYWQNQIAKTAAALLGFDYQNEEEVGKSLIR
jgi:hypothetical protein